MSPDRDGAFPGLARTIFPPPSPNCAVFGSDFQVTENMRCFHVFTCFCIVSCKIDEF